MDHFHYRDNQLFCEDVSVAELADKFGTPLYVYSATTILDQLKALQTAFAEVKPLVCYSVKANSNLGVLKLLADNGSAFDVVSGGELHRVIIAGGKANQTVFAGVGQDGSGDLRGAACGRLDV